MTYRRIVTLVIMAALPLLGGGGAVPVDAEMIFRFEPSLEVSLIHDGDVGSSPTEESVADELLVLRPVLSAVGTSTRSTVGLSYAPLAMFYSSSSDLNLLNHQAVLNFSRTLKRRGSWDLGCSFLDTSDAYSDLLVDEIVVARSGRQLWNANTAVAVGVSERVDLSFRYIFRDLEYDEPDLIGYSSHTAGTSASLVTGPRSNIGLDYAYQYFLYPESDDNYSVHNLLTRYSLRPTAKTTLNLAGGLFIQDYQPAATSDGLIVDEDRTGFLGNVDWGFEGRRFGYNIGVTRSVRASGGIGESVVSNALRLSMTGSLGRRGDVGITGSYQQNEPTLSEAAGVDLLRGSLNFGYELGRFFYMRLFFDYIDQQWESDDLRDLSYPRAGLSLIIRAASAGGGASSS